LFVECSTSIAVTMFPVMAVAVTFGLCQLALSRSSLKLFLVVDLDLAVVAVVMVLVWQAAVVDMPPRCSTLTATTSLLVLLHTPFVLVQPVDVPAVVVATVEQDVVSMDVLRSFLVVDLALSVCKVDPLLHTDVPTAAIPA
jgi:hypothetical protein